MVASQARSSAVEALLGQEAHIDTMLQYVVFLEKRQQLIKLTILSIRVRRCPPRDLGDQAALLVTS